MKVFISVDMEGITGNIGWEHVDRTRPEYQAGRSRMVGDCNAAIQGALDAGATEIVVNDSHDRMMNLVLDDLNPKARLISGIPKPLSMMQGVEGADAAIFVGYHARMGTRAASMDHTYFGSSVSRVLLNDDEVGEPELNAAIAGHFSVPVVFLSGDGTVCCMVKESIGPWVQTAAVKTSVGRTAAECLHPEVSHPMIQEGVRVGLNERSTARPVEVDCPVRIEVEFFHTDMADSAAIYPGATRLDGRRVIVEGKTALEAFFALRTVATLATFPALLRRL